MHIYFSGIGGAGISPIALIANQAGYEVSGSDKQMSSYLEYLQSQGISDIHIGQNTEDIASLNARKPIDWLVYSSALPMENPHHPELTFAHENGIKATKRDEFLTQFLADKNLKMVAIAGTHGKTTTTAMAVWLLQQLSVPMSYVLPAKTSFASLGAYDPNSEYFVYEADEFDRNFLAFQPTMSLITGIDWDHPDIYPTREEYNQAFRDFIGQSDMTYIWQPDAEIIDMAASTKVSVLKFEDYPSIQLPGHVNRQNAALVAQGMSILLGQPDIAPLIEILNTFPGVSRRFERIAPGIFSDYAHTPPKIRGALQLGREVAGEKLVVVYEGLHNTRQHFIKDELRDLFEDVKSLYIVPSYLAREDQSLQLLSPDDLRSLMSETVQLHTTPSELNDDLKKAIKQHVEEGDTVLCLTAGGGGSLDEWLRREFS